MPAIAPLVDLIGVLSTYIDITSANLELPTGFGAVAMT